MSGTEQGPLDSKPGAACGFQLKYLEFFSAGFGTMKPSTPRFQWPFDLSRSSPETRVLDAASTVTAARWSFRIGLSLRRYGLKGNVRSSRSAYLGFFSFTAGGQGDK